MKTETWIIPAGPNPPKKNTRTGANRCPSIQIPGYNLDAYVQCVRDAGHSEIHTNQFGGSWW